MRRSRMTALYHYCMAALILTSGYVGRALAQEVHTQLATNQQAVSNADKASALINIVRNATERFKDVKVAEAEGYALQFGCVSGPDSGAMGLHFINGQILSSGIIDPSRPPIVIYEPVPGGGLRLIGADFLVFADSWNASHSSPPELMGQLFQFFESPNRFELPAFYTLHVWAWKENPNGAFVNWHPHVKCQAFSGQNP